MFTVAFECPNVLAFFNVPLSHLSRFVVWHKVNKLTLNQNDYFKGIVNFLQYLENQFYYNTLLRIATFIEVQQK